MRLFHVFQDGYDVAGVYIVLTDFIAQRKIDADFLASKGWDDDPSAG